MSIQRCHCFEQQQVSTNIRHIARLVQLGTTHLVAVLVVAEDQRSFTSGQSALSDVLGNLLPSARQAVVRHVLLDQLVGAVLADHIELAIVAGNDGVIHAISGDVLLGLGEGLEVIGVAAEDLPSGSDAVGGGDDVGGPVHHEGVARRVPDGIRGPGHASIVGRDLGEARARPVLEVGGLPDDDGLGALGRHVGVGPTTGEAVDLEVLLQKSQWLSGVETGERHTVAMIQNLLLSGETINEGSRIPRVPTLLVRYGWPFLRVVHWLGSLLLLTAI